MAPGCTLVRYAKKSDIPSIVKLFAEHGNEHLHPRSCDFFMRMIENNFSVVMEKEGDKNAIVAYIEFCLLFSEIEVESLFTKILGVDNPCFLVPFLPGDVFVYSAGGLRDPSFKFSGWMEESMRFSVTRWRGANTEERRNRIVIVSGHTGIQQPSENSVKKGFEIVAPNKEMTHLKMFQVQMPFNRHQMGSMVFRIYDKPLSAHQLERTKRNRYLITELEQRRLLGCRIGIVGLSTGSIALEALLRQGIGGIYRLADFDKFEVSNGNRMLFDKNDVGRSKLELCKERVKSCDPDILIEEFPDGISRGNVAKFVQDCDIIIEECDDFLVKFLVRKEAMQFRKPLLMATSQNGMIDIERYDIDEKVKPFHLEDTDVLSSLVEPNLSAQAKAHMLSKLFDTRLLSSRFTESSKEIGKSISSWPQLAEEVFLNAATLTHACRRILLGDREIMSGRFSFDMNSLFVAKNRISTSTPPPSRL
eukprot:CAMPEP_0195300450 /NCGR_PEP_ID=MMETSP0707-20130614/27438_1 /TAXON_ID=33640 /ORGANISM="Asterionellopsis glacialis, Strain CCMP134" /LENGTH=475 /DNA_ID=CAMNT_0040363135 /DNA_START=95 /DNA_END=1522 /DNA_ORIENTATION=-